MIVREHLVQRDRALEHRLAVDREPHRDHRDAALAHQLGRQRGRAVSDDRNGHAETSAGLSSTVPLVRLTETRSDDSKTSTPDQNRTRRAGSSVPTTGQRTPPTSSPAAPAAIAAAASPERITMWNTANARIRCWPSRSDWSVPMPDESVHATPAPKSTAPTNARPMVGARLNAATTIPRNATPYRVARSRPMSGARQIARRPRAAPTPNSAISTPNCASLARRSVRTKSMPSENNAPSPSATATVAGSTARTSGIANASRKRTRGRDNASWSPVARRGPSSEIRWIMYADTTNDRASSQNA